MKKQEEEEFLQGYQGVNISKQQTAAVAAPEPEPAVTPAAETVPESEEPTDMVLSEVVTKEELKEAIRDDISNTHYVQADINNSFSEEDLDELDINMVARNYLQDLFKFLFQNPSTLPTTENSDPDVFTDIPGPLSAPSSSEPALDPTLLQDK